MVPDKDLNLYQDAGDYEFPFLQEVFTPREAHKVEYERSPWPLSMFKLIDFQVLSSSTV